MQMSETNGETQNRKKGLGRGLGALLQTHGSHTLAEAEMAESKPSVKPVTQATATARPPLELSGMATPNNNQDKLWMLSIEKLKSGKYQPRKNFDKQALDELAASIKEHGILQPLVVRSVGAGQFEIIAGERRWRAAQAVGLHEVPAIIKTFDNQKTLELSLIENLQREDLNPIEEAEGYQRLINEFSLTQEKVAEKVGKERTTVANALRLLKLAPEVRNLVQTGLLSQGHAKVLLAIQDSNQQKELANQVTNGGLSVRKLEELVQKKLTPIKVTDGEAIDPKASVTQRLISGLADEMQKLLGTKVSIDYAKSKGKMSIYFYSDDELTNIIEKLRGGAKS
jgi:ParB family chromosome partitioning protein